MNIETATIIAAIAAAFTAVIIYWQGTLLKGQIELQTLIDLESQWNDGEMRRLRANVFKGEGDILDRLEKVLEFLENFGTYHRRGALDPRRVWDSNLGWYASRYYFYHEAEIESIRKKWKDETVYKNLHALFESYVVVEARIRKISKAVVKNEFADTKAEFIALESLV